MKQPFIHDTGKISRTELKQHLKTNYDLVPAYDGQDSFTNQDYLVRDLHPANIIKSESGIIHFIDPIVSVNPNTVIVPPFNLKKVNLTEDSILRKVADLSDTENGEPFYSQIERTVENFRQEKMSSGQALETGRRILTLHIRASERVYITYLDAIRIDAFEKFSRQIYEYNARKGITDAEEIKAQHEQAAKFIN